MKAFFTKALLFGLCLTAFSFSSSAQTVYTLDWASFGWTAGDTTGTVTNIGSSGVNCSVLLKKSTLASVYRLTGTSSGTQTPTVSGAAISVANSSSLLQVSMDFADSSDYTDIIYTFSSAVTGLKFNVADIDKTNATSTAYLDRIIVSGTNGNTIYYPVISKYVVSSNVLGIVTGNVATANLISGQGGNSASSASDQSGTVMVDFGTNVLKTVTIRYKNAPGADVNPSFQLMGIGNTSFQRVNVPPVSNNFTNVRMLQGLPATAIPGLVANDADGSIASYTITSIPTAAQGVLSCCGGTTLNAGSVLTPAQAATLQFDPVSNYTGTASFTFTATDNLGAVSNTATYRLPVLSQAPVANNTMENTMANTAAATAIQPLSATDVDGTISTYQILSLPPASEGVLSVSCPTTFTGTSCVFGYQDLTAAVLAAYPSGIPLSATQASNMRFDPAPGFVGNATFTYNVTDNSGNISTTANYTIPVAATAAISRPPLADNIVAQSMNSSLSATTIPSLQANDLDGNIISYRILSIPDAATQGTLYCCGGSTVAVNQVLTPAQAATLQFDPLQTFTGTATFTYTATDNSSLVSNTATYSLPVVNRTPVSTNLSATVSFNSPVTAIPALSGYDADGTIASYTIASVPTASQGTISVLCPVTGASCVGGYADLTPAVLTANSNAIILTPAQAASIRFVPATNFTGTATFNYTSTDNNGNVSAPAIYNIRVNAQPPVANDVTNAATLANTLAATTISGLSATDADGTIASYTIITLPASTEGVLSVGGTPVTVGQVLTPAQAAALQFDPAAGFTGISSFSYLATDNAGYVSNTAAYNIPVSGTGNIPPIARNIINAPLSNTLAATAINALSATDVDGTISSYTVLSIPPASQGVLSIAGVPVTAGQVLTPAQAATLRFDPTLGFTGNANFTYVATDNSGATSYGATYTIPVSGIAPVANSITAPSMAQTAGATSITSLSATDADGTIANYYITSIPATTQGVISVPCTVMLTGATCVTGYQALTAAVLANYPLGIPLTSSQATSLRFTPSTTYTGNVVFNYYADDNSGQQSNLASYTLPVSGLNPISNNVVANKILTGSGTNNILSLNSSDADGTIGSYVITSLPSSSQGALSIPCPAPSGAVCIGGYATLTASVLSANPGGIVLTPVQAAALRFTPAVGFTGNAAFNYAAYDNNSNLSNIAAYTIPVGSSATLPVSLVNFSAERSGNNIMVNWKAENEMNINRYEVEYSTDNINFTNGGIVSAKNQGVSKYNYALVNYTAPVYYIRLKTIESGGKTNYSSIVILRLNGNGYYSLSLAPNPTNVSVTVKINAAASGNAKISIVNMVGQTVYQQVQEVVKGENNITVNKVQQMANGSYMLQATINGETLSQRFIVNK